MLRTSATKKRKFISCTDADIMPQPEEFTDPDISQDLDCQQYEDDATEDYDLEEVIADMQDLRALSDAEFQDLIAGIREQDTEYQTPSTQIL